MSREPWRLIGPRPCTIEVLDGPLLSASWDGGPARHHDGGGELSSPQIIVVTGGVPGYYFARRAHLGATNLDALLGAWGLFRSEASASRP